MNELNKIILWYFYLTTCSSINSLIINPLFMHRINSFTTGHQAMGIHPSISFWSLPLHFQIYITMVPCIYIDQWPLRYPFILHQDEDTQWSINFLLSRKSSMSMIGIKTEISQSQAHTTVDLTSLDLCLDKFTSLDIYFC